MKTITTILFVCITQPIWIYLMYQVLQSVNASDIMWFLFWVYVPVTILTLLLKMLADEQVKT